MLTFDLCDALPSGTTVLEASAGTGKTHAIASLAVRYLAEGIVSASELAIITFSRAATSELKGRVHDRIHSVKDALEAEQMSSRTADDELVALLVNGSATEIDERRARLVKATTEFNKATVMTIHEFCGAMLSELGILASVDPHAVLVEDLTQLIGETVSDIYLSRYGDTETPPLTPEQAFNIGKAVAEQPSAKIISGDSKDNLLARLAFAQDFLAEFASRKQRLGIYSFSDQLLRLKESLMSTEEAAAKMRRRFSVILVDEFQDTDLVQWEVIKKVFHTYSTLILVGDPKQSIYRFRGADLFAYKNATDSADQKLSLATNYRSDAELVSAVGDLFENAELGQGVAVERISAAQRESRLVRSPFGSKARLRCLSTPMALSVKSIRREITTDVVAEVAELLGSAKLLDGNISRELTASDIAILVSTNERGIETARALVKAGIPAAFAGADSVFKTDACKDWLILLRALHESTRSESRQAILTGFIGASLTDLLNASEAKYIEWASCLRDWSVALRDHGPATLFALIKSSGLTERILAKPFGERILTDYSHIAAELNAKYRRGIQGAQLIGWLEQRAKTEALGTALRKLESDSNAVQIMTIHRAKGLQWPVVLLPDVWDKYQSLDRGLPFTFHDDDNNLLLDIGEPRKGSRLANLRKANSESADDELRRLYVACTRAQSHLTLWWALSSTNTQASALQRILYRDRAKSQVPLKEYPISDAASFLPPTRLGWISTSGIEASEVTSRELMPLRRLRADDMSLSPPDPFERVIDSDWRRTSYSGLTASAHDHFSSELLSDEPVIADISSPPITGSTLAKEALSPLAGFPAGATFGSMVHEIYEQIDWYLPSGRPVSELESRLEEVSSNALKRFPLPISSADLASGLLPSLLTPLGKLTDGRSLAAIPVRDRLAELDFEYPLGSHHKVEAIADLFASELDSCDPLADYHKTLRSPDLASQPLRGFLVGSIDAVLRVGNAKRPRYVVIDYKTNSIVSAATARPSDYSMSAMAAEMMKCHYPLQAILYCVALHRFLCLRMPNYDPDQHLGGVGYLFVRGLDGLKPTLIDSAPTGVFSWFPPTSLVLKLSELLAGGEKR